MIDSKERSIRGVVGVDLGGTKIAAGLVLPDGQIPVHSTAPTPAAKGADAIISTVVDLVYRVLDEARRTGLPEARGIGIGSAGVIDPVSGNVLSSTEHLTGWGGTPLAELMTRRIGLPVRVVNDVHAHAMGEAHYGAGKGKKLVLVVAAGTGLGGSLIVNGKPMTGARHVAGHLGHVPSTAAHGLLCSCGRTGHLEAVASGPGLLALYRRRGGSAQDTREVFARAEAGESLAATCISIAGQALGQAIGGWVNMLDPEIVVLTGGLAASGPLWWAAVRKGAQEQYIDAVVDCSLLPASSGNLAAILGAAALFENVPTSIAAHTGDPSCLQ